MFLVPCWSQAFLLGPLITPVASRIAGEWVNPIGMGLEAATLLCLAWLIDATARGMSPASAPLAAILFVMGCGQGLAMPTLMRMIKSRVAPAFSGMVAGIASSTLQVSTSLSVAAIGGIFYTIVGECQDAATITHAFIVAALCMASSLAAGAVLGISLARRRAGRLSTVSGR